MFQAAQKSTVRALHVGTIRQQESVSITIFQFIIDN